MRVSLRLSLLCRAALAITGLFSIPVLSPAGVERGPQLVKDIRSDAEVLSSSPKDFCHAGDTLYFSAQDLRHGRELWKTDGTPEGTVMVKDVMPGRDSSSFDNRIPLGNVVIFYDGQGTGGLWRTDGTTEGTYLLRAFATPILAWDGRVYFVAGSPAEGTELWSTDGTVAGTGLVKDLRPGPNSSDPSHFAVMGGMLYFHAVQSGESGAYWSLWKSDGTAGGTSVVKDFNDSQVVAIRMSGANNRLYFAGGPYATGAELWTSDGTSAGTVLLREFQPGTAGGNPREFKSAGNCVYFLVDSAAGTGLWRTDGTADGTILLRLLNPDGLPPGDSGFVASLIVSGNRLIFTASDAQSGWELWTTDGTPGGTVLFKDLAPGADSSRPGNFSTLGETLYFITWAPSGSGVLLWRSDGTPEGTLAVNFPVYPGPLAAAGDRFYFGATGNPPDTAGMELWVSDGTTQGTRLLKDIRQATKSSNPGSLTAVGDMLYFTALAPGIGTELWKTDGTAAGTVLVKDIVPGPGSSQVMNPTVMGGALYFTAFNGVADQVLWRSNGTAATTVPILTVSGASGAANLTVAGSTLYFTANTFAEGEELWKTGGTAATTVRVRNINAIPYEDSRPYGLAALGNTLFFIANDGVNPRGLWVSDGTSAGTVRIADFADQSAVKLVPMGGAMYFQNQDPVNFTTLWRSDGTAGGTGVVTNPYPGYTLVRNLTVHEGALYFTTESAQETLRFWRSDGSAAGTAPVMPGFNEGVAFYASSISAAGGHLYLNAFHEFTTGPLQQKGNELWQSDGSAAGTFLVKDINPGIVGSEPEKFTESGGMVYFTAVREGNGRELWRTDGTAEGTVMMRDITRDASSGIPSTPPMDVRGPLVSTGGKLFFAGNSPEHGIELFVLDTAQGDGDGDTLPDNWEDNVLGGRSSGPDDDPDGDGQANISEWLAGTHPSKGGDYLRLSPVAGSGARVRFRILPVVTDVLYRLESSATMAEGSWRTETELNYPTPGEGEITAWTPAVLPRFYRLRALPLPQF